MAVELLSSGNANGLGSNASGTFSTAALGAFLPGDVIVASISYFSNSAPPTNQPTLTLGNLSLTRIGTTLTFFANRYFATFIGVIPDKFNNNNSASVFLFASVPGTGQVVELVWSVWTGVDQATPQDATIVDGTPGTTTASLTGITTVTNGAVVIASCGSTDDGTNGAGGNSGIVGVNNGFTTLVNVGTTSGQDASAAQFYKTMSAAGASGTTTLTVDTGDSAAGHTLALRPISTPYHSHKVFVNRSPTMGIPQAGAGTFSRACVDPITTTIDRKTAVVGDVAICAMWWDMRGLGSSVLTAPGGVWVPIIENRNAGSDRTIQVYYAPWSPSLTWPTFGTFPSNTAHLAVMGCILRDIDINSIFDVVSTHSVGNNATVTFPAITPTKADAVLLRMSFVRAGANITTSLSSGLEGIVVPCYDDATITDVQSDTAAVWALEKHTAGAGVSCGTATYGIVTTLQWSAITIAFNRTPNISTLVPPVTVGAIDVEIDIDSFASAIFLEPEVEVDPVEIDIELRTTRIRRPKERVTAWVSDLAGNRVAAILSSEEFG